MKIVAATIDDARLIGEAVVDAIGPELAREFAGEHTVDDVVRLFSRLAARTDSQYSYLNALKAVDDDGSAAGVIVAYDGGRLHELRKAFFEEVKLVLDRDMDGKMPDECDSDEYYLDSLSVLPQYRGRGIARTLIEAMSERSHMAGKPLGLLCDKSNLRARRLYDSAGFRQVGERMFAWELMDHLRK